MTKSTSTGTGSEGTVIDFTEIRAQKMEEKRRKSERVFLNHVLGVYSVSGNNSLQQIELIDLSDDGCSFQVPYNPDKPFSTEAGIPIRLYFSQDNYLQIFVHAQNERDVVQNGIRYKRFGCTVDPTTASFAAYTAFVNFLKAFAEVSRKDEGGMNLFFV